MEVLTNAIHKIQHEQRASQEIQRSLKDELRGASDKLKDLFTTSQEREERDRHYFQNLITASKNIESIMQGSKTKGIAGENIVREILKIFPQGTMVYDFKLGSKVVEFGLKLPDGRILPIDSKILAIEELTKLQDIDDESDKLRLIARIESAVLKQAKEVGGYISPPLTYERAIMAVPDAIHYVLKESILRAHRDYGVMIIPYSMTIPYILSFMDLQRKHATHLDEARLKSFLEDLVLSLSKIDDILDNKIAKGGVMITNAYNESKQMVGKLRGEAVTLTSASDIPQIEEAVND